VAELVNTTPEFPLEAGLVPNEEKGPVIYKAEKEETFKIGRDDDGAYVVKGEAVEKLFKMTDFNRDESVQRFARTLRGMGIDEALRSRGIEDGDIVRILDFEFEFVE
jgi:GTP-binding protein